MIVSFLPGSAIPGNSDSQADNSSILSVCSAASFQPSLDKAGNAVGGTVTGRQWHEHKLTSRIQGWQDCLHKYMSNRKMDAGGPPDPCFFDTGAGTALSLLSGRALLQASSDIPNYAAASAPPGAGSAGGSNSIPASSKPPPGAAAAANQNPFVAGNQAAASGAAGNASSTIPSAAAATSSGGVARGKVTVDPPPVVEQPQPIGPDPRDFQQTKDFLPGTRLTRSQAVLLLSGRGFHHGH